MQRTITIKTEHDSDYVLFKALAHRLWLAITETVTDDVPWRKASILTTYPSEDE